MLSRSRYRFPLVFFLSLKFVFSIIISLVIYALFLQDKARAYYLEFLEQINQTSSNIQSPSWNRKQKREKVSKEIWRSTPFGRLHCHLTSPISHLLSIKNPVNDSQETVENLEEITLWLQHEIYYKLPNGLEFVIGSDEKGNSLPLSRSQKTPLAQLPPNWQQQAKAMQQVDHITAQKASHFISNQQLVAYDVHILRYEIPSHVLPATNVYLEPIMVGKTDRLEMNFQGTGEDTKSAWNFKANRLHTYFYNK